MYKQQPRERYEDWTPEELITANRYDDGKLIYTPKENCPKDDNEFYL